MAKQKTTAQKKQTNIQQEKNLVPVQIKAADASKGSNPLLDSYLQRQNSAEEILKRSSDENIAQAIRDLLLKDTIRKDTLH